MYLFVNFFGNTIIMIQKYNIVVQAMHTMALNAPVISTIVQKEYASLPGMFNLTCNSMNQQLFKKNICHQNNPYENNGRFLLWMKAIPCLPENRHFLQWAKINGTQRRAFVSLLPHHTTILHLMHTTQLPLIGTTGGWLLLIRHLEPQRRLSL